MAQMTPRERVLAAVGHQEPDRVPIDVGGGSSTSLVVETYDKLKQSLGVSGETQILNRVFRVARLDECVMQRLGSDCRPVTAKPSSRWKPAPSRPGTFVDNWGVAWKKACYAEGCFYWELVRSPLAEASLHDLDCYPWPDPEDPGFTDHLAEETRALYRDTPYALVADPVFKNLWELGVRLRGFEQLLMDVVLDPGFVSALISKLLEIHIVATGRFLDAVGPYIQVFRAGDDLATQSGPLFSLDCYRKILKPAYKKYFDFARSKTEARIFYHSCGNVTDLIEDLVEIGVEILNPVQVSAMGETAELKARFGHKVVFWGGVDTQYVLPRGSVKDVEAEVRRRIHDLAPGGGFVLAAVHNIQPDVPPQNILAMVDAARKFGTYPLQV